MILVSLLEKKLLNSYSRFKSNAPETIKNKGTAKRPISAILSKVIPSEITPLHMYITLIKITKKYITYLMNFPIMA